VDHSVVKDVVDASEASSSDAVIAALRSAHVLPEGETNE